MAGRAPGGWYSPHPGLKLSVPVGVCAGHQGYPIPAAAEGDVAATDVDVSSVDHITKNRGGLIAGQVVAGQAKSGDCFVFFDSRNVLELDGDVAHVLLWFAVVAFDVIKMADA